MIAVIMHGLLLGNDLFCTLLFTRLAHATVFNLANREDKGIIKDTVNVTSSLLNFKPSWLRR